MSSGFRRNMCSRKQPAERVDLGVLIGISSPTRIRFRIGFKTAYDRLYRGCVAQWVPVCMYCL
jgi:hypothetical protein